VGDAFGYPFCAQISIPSSTERVKKKKNCWLVLEGVTTFGDRPGAKNRNRRDLREEKIFGKKKIFWLVLEWVTPSVTLFVLKFQFRAQLSEIG
jgi:hypothetical protein